MGPNVKDERLVARIRAGDQRAFERLVDRYERPLLSFCRHMLGRAHDAEDAVQQTFVSAYEVMLRDPERHISLRAWLFTIARNQCLTMLRARRYRADGDVVEPSTIGLAAEVEGREDLRHLLRDLADLPPDQRAALLLLELGALERDEIAAVVGCDPKKVKALVFQARSHLATRRIARDTPCTEIREQLATLTGGALRRAHLRRHVSECPGCQAFQAEVRRQRAALSVVLPVVPAAAFKSSVLAAVTGGSGTGALAAGVATGSAGGGLLTATAVKAALLTVGVMTAGAGGIVAVDHARSDSKPVVPSISARTNAPSATTFAPALRAPARGRAVGAAAGAHPAGGSRSGPARPRVSRGPRRVRPGHPARRARLPAG